MQKQEPTKGFMIVASTERNFYLYALNLIESIKDYYPEAQCALGVSPYLKDGRESVADYVFDVGDTPREKLIGLTKTPYDLTCYIDADCEVQHEDIATVFDQLGDNDIVFSALTEEREYCYAERKFPGGEFTLCGANFVYDNRKPLVKEFMQDWKDIYWSQHPSYENTWWPKNDKGEWDFDLYPESLRQWDQFTLWWLTNKVDKYKELKYDVFEDDARWNWFALYIESKVPIKAPPIITHHSWGIDKYDKYVGNIG